MGKGKLCKEEVMNNANTNYGINIKPFWSLLSNQLDVVLRIELKQ